MNTTAPAQTSTRAAAWIGIDVAKASFDAALVQTHTAELHLRHIPAATFERTPDGVAALLAWIDALAPDSPPRAVLEATGRYGSELAAWILAARPALAPAIINARAAYYFANSLTLRDKSDRTDARSLALFGLERNPDPWQPPHPLQQELRELSRFRQTLIENRAEAKTRLKENYASKTVARMIEKQIDRLSADIARVEREMDKVIAKMPRTREDLDRLQTIDGVGKTTAAAILAEAGDLRQFACGRKLTAYAGVCPSRKQSGANAAGRTRMSKIGSPRIRKILYMAALATIRKDNAMAAMYHRMVAAGKARKSALGAVMRKLLLTMRAMLVNNQDYIPHPTKPCEKLPLQSTKST